ncbi:MAG TPA: hypothetical protein O0X27_03505, partial [Methanocorpusculum sp.]|nr:hypothetical protein [Methanocorpusculum sp.]
MVKSLSIPHAENIIRSLSESYQDYPYPGGMIRDTIRRKESLPIMWREELKRIAKIIDITTESPKAKGVAIWCRLKDMESTSAATFSQFISLYPRHIRIKEVYRTLIT